MIGHNLVLSSLFPRWRWFLPADHDLCKSTESHGEKYLGRLRPAIALGKADWKDLVPNEIEEVMASSKSGWDP